MHTIYEYCSNVLKTLFMVYICEQHITIMARLAIIIIIIIIIALPVVFGRGQHVFIILPLIVSMVYCVHCIIITVYYTCFVTCQ